MIKCTNCNAENLLGAIFCRECGQKLDLDNLKPEHIEGSAKKAAKTTAHIVRNLIVLVIILAIGGVVALIFIPPGSTEAGAVAENDAQIARTRLVELMTKRGVSKTFTAPEANLLLTEAMLLTDEEKEKAAIARAESGASAYLVPDAIAVELIPDSSARFVLKEMAFGKVPIYFSVTGTASVTEGTPGVQFEPTAVTAGRLPVIGGYLQEQVFGLYRKLMDGSDRYKKLNDMVLTQLTQVTVATDQVTLKK